MGVDRAYFVVGGDVLYYDVNADRATGEQRPLGALWHGMPPEFSAGMDAAVDLGSFQLYVFRGDSYLRIPFGTQAVDDGYPRPIAGNWPGLSFDRIDAAMNWGDGKVYLFRGPEYVRYDIAADRQDDGYPKPIAGNWKHVDAGWVGDGIDAAVNLGNGRAYFFKGTEYVAIDWNTKTQLDGYPLAVDGLWPGLTGPFDAAWTNAVRIAPHGTASSGAAAFYQSYHGYAATSEAETGVPVLVTLGQAALESGWGRHAPGNNFFGVKARATDPPESRQLLRTREVLDRPDAAGFPEIISVTPRPDGRYDYVVRDWFAVYPTPAESFTAHGRFLRNNSRYARAFDHTGDPYSFAKAVADAGYATAPNYYDVLSGRMRDLEASAH